MDNELVPIINDDVDIKKRIYTIRGQQVMLDSDIAELFEVETKYLNRQMNRNFERFPEDFCFRLKAKDLHNLRCQNVTAKFLSSKRRYNPYVYTEHGVIALAGILKSDVAAKMSIEIVRTFIRMRQFIKENGDILLGLAKLQNRQLEFENETNLKFEEVFKKIDQLDLPKNALFYAGQWYDAFDFITLLIQKADASLILIDPYFDSKALPFLAHKKDGVSITVISSRNGKNKGNEIKIFESQYGHMEIKIQNDIHDRFLIIDELECYGLGSSLNYAGKKLFEIHKVTEKGIISLLLNKISGNQ